MGNKVGMFKAMVFRTWLLFSLIFLIFGEKDLTCLEQLSILESTSSPQAEEVSAKDLILISPQGARNMTVEIPWLRSGSLPALPFRQAGVRLDNFSSLSFLKL
jgi:hypothetical protein